MQGVGRPTQSKTGHPSKDGGHPTYGFKLLVTTSVRHFDNHLSCSRQYSVLRDCAICFMVNLCTDDKLVGYFGEQPDYFGEVIPHVIPVHMVYDSKKRSANIYYGDIKKHVSIKGCAW